MATRQYIGARYVPKFYENSVGTAEWRAGVIYEPLTIVTWNGNSYTSKKTVPAEIGEPGLNPSYWVATGNFNEQLARLTEDVNEILGEIRGIDAPPVNVLSLGVKNDGSEDCTELVNAALEDNAVYFPIGIYRFDGSIIANHSIYGAGYTEEYRDNENAANLQFTNDTSNNIIISNTGSSIVLKGFNIVRTWSASWDALHSTTNRRIIIEDIGIFNSGGGNAIYFNQGTSISRNAHIRNVAVIGDFERGIYMQYAPDSVIRDCSFLRCKIGIELIYSGFTQINNVHCWSVPYNDSRKNNAYWSATRGFVFRNNSDCTCDGLYSDSCFIDVACINSRVMIGSLRSWIDNGHDTYATDKTGQLAYVDGNSFLSIAKLMTQISPFKTVGISPRNALEIGKAIVYSSENYVGYLGSYPIPDRGMYFIPAAAGNYQAVAVLRHRYGGYASLIIQQNNDQVEVTENPVGTFTKTVRRGSGFDVYQKTVQGADGFNNIVFYVPKNAYTITIQNFQRGSNYGLVDYDGVYDINRQKMILPSQADTAGLVEIN